MPVLNVVEFTGLLVFKRGEEYGINTLKAQRVPGYKSVTRGVKVPRFMRRVVNLRGNAVSIVNKLLRSELGTQLIGSSPLSLSASLTRLTAW